MLVDVLEFILPRGRTEPQQLEVADDCAVGYESMRRHHCRLTAERLSTGQISTTIEHEEGDYTIEICPHDFQALRAAVEKMLRRFDPLTLEAWLDSIKAEEKGGGING